MLRAGFSSRGPLFFLRTVGCFAAIALLTERSAFLTAIFVVAATIVHSTPKKKRLLSPSDPLLVSIGSWATFYFGLVLKMSMLPNSVATWTSVAASTVIWFAPAIASLTVVKILRNPFDRRWKLVVLQLIVLAFAYLILREYDSILALSIVPVLLGIAVTIALLARISIGRLSALKPVFLLLAFAFVARSFSGLSPTFDFQKVHARTNSQNDLPTDGLKSYYQKWDKVRGGGPNAPIILVAAAGGGIRAALHTASSLAYADTQSEGKFGNRVFAISAVSGGALGALIWESSREEEFPLPPTPDESASYMPAIPATTKFFSMDFVSTSANRLLLRDLPYASLPFPSIGATRDQGLRDSWIDAWKQVEATNHVKADGGRFTAPFALSPLSDGQSPVLVFNSTSAADGQRVIRSNIPLALPVSPLFNKPTDGDLANDTTVPSATVESQFVPSLDPSVRGVDAAYDSARFPLVSTVGFVCSDTQLEYVAKNISTDLCASKENSYNHEMSITDGGYADNSGMASAFQIASRLHEIGVDWKRIYIVFISSNPVEGLDYNEGDRFESGRLTATLLAPLSMMEAARSGRATSFVQSAEGSDQAPRVIEWALSDADRSNLAVSDRLVQEEKTASNTVTSFAGFRIYGANDRATTTKGKNAVDRARARNFPPLGWTLDTTAAQGINLYAVSHTLFYRRACDARYALDEQLCESVFRSPVH